jgi:hypothetical protein
MKKEKMDQVVKNFSSSIASYHDHVAITFYPVAISDIYNSACCYLMGPILHPRHHERRCSHEERFRRRDDISALIGKWIYTENNYWPRRCEKKAVFSSPNPCDAGFDRELPKIYSLYRQTANPSSLFLEMDSCLKNPSLKNKLGGVLHTKICENSYKSKEGSFV